MMLSMHVLTNNRRVLGHLSICRSFNIIFFAIIFWITTIQEVPPDKRTVLHTFNISGILNDTNINISHTYDVRIVPTIFTVAHAQYLWRWAESYTNGNYVSMYQVYCLNGLSMTHTQCASYCRNTLGATNGWDLATFPSSAVASSFLPYVALPTNDEPNMFIALKRDGSSQVFRWAAGRVNGLAIRNSDTTCNSPTYATRWQSMTYTNCAWAANEPNNADNVENCGSFSINSKSGQDKLNDIVCDKYYTDKCFICERSPCQSGVDCRAGVMTVPSNSYYPSCTCSCTSGWSGTDCSDTSIVVNSLYTSQYTFPFPSASTTTRYTRSDAISYCTGLGDGWALATFPTLATRQRAAVAVAASFTTWVGASDEQQKGTWRWTHGRLKDLAFGSGAAATTYNYRPVATVRAQFSYNSFTAGSSPSTQSFAAFSGGGVAITQVAATDLRLHACERSACDLSIDCNSLTATALTASSTFHPNCGCTCKAYDAANYHSGAKCLTTTVSHGAYASEYSLACGDDELTFDDAQAACVAKGAGWALATFPTTTSVRYFSDQLQHHERTWVGASDSTTANRWEWTHGRLAGQAFHSGGSCLTYDYVPAAMSLALSSLGCSWAASEPAVSATANWAVFSAKDKLSAHGGTATCYACERSACKLDVDCNSKTSTMTGLHYPNCACTCKSATYSGPQCTRTTVNHTLYVSEYEVVCGDAPVTYAAARDACRSLTTDGGGWDIASVPLLTTVTALSAQVNPHASTWVGATRNETAWVWAAGRLAGRRFFTLDGACSTIDYRPMGAVATFNSCGWASGEPNDGATKGCAGFTSDGLLQDEECASTLRCFTCERSPCKLSIDCYEPNTISMTGAYYGSCTCTCKSGAFGPKCEWLSVTDHGPYVSEYKMVDVDAAGPDAARAACGIGWDLATIPTSTSLSQLNIRLSGSRSAWIGASFISENAWKWSAGRLANLEFYRGNVCGRTPLLGFDSTSFFEDCLWSVDEPLSGECAVLKMNEITGIYAMSARACEGTVDSAVCERSPCKLGVDCYEPNTLSMTGGYYGNCTCTCKPGKGGKRCEYYREDATASTSNTQSTTTTTSLSSSRSDTTSTTTSLTQTTSTSATLSASIEETDSLSLSSSISYSSSESITSDISASATFIETASMSPRTTPSVSSTNSKSPTGSLTVISSLTPSESVSDSPTFTITVSASIETSMSRTLSLMPVVPPLPATLSAVGFGYRYFVHKPLVLAYVLFSVPLPFASVYRHWQVRRFLSTESGNGHIRIALGHNSSDPSALPLVNVAMSRSSQHDDWIVLNGVYVSDFVNPDDGSRTGSLSKCTCNTLVRGTEPLNLSAINGRSPFEWSLEFGPQLQKSFCRSGISFSGLAYSTHPFLSGPTLHYAFMPPNKESVDYFLANIWLGDSGIIFDISQSYDGAVLIGDHQSPERRPTPARAQAVRLLSVGGSAKVRISSDTHSAAACTIADQISYNATFLDVNASWSPPGVARGCFMYDTVDDLHLACTKTADCVGFTTIEIAYSVPKELPLCMYVETLAARGTDVMPYRRMLYTKPSIAPLPTCTLNVRQSGFVAVYVQQTVLASASVFVRVDNTAVARCGATSAFSNGFYGVNGRCNQWALCYVGHVTADANISVTPSSLLSQGGCSNSLGILVQQTSVDLVQVTAGPRTPPPRLDMTRDVFATRDIRRIALDHKDPIRLLVYHSLNGALDVRQTAHRQMSSRDPTVIFSGPSSSQSCGGPVGFLGGRPGESDQCDVYQFCGNILPLLVSGAGFVTVTADMRNALQFTDSCLGFQGTVYATALSSLPAFPLLAFDGRFATLLGLRNSDKSLAPSNAVRLATVGPRDMRVDAYYVPSYASAGPLGFGNTSSSIPIQATLSNISTQICIVDHNKDEAIQCTFYIPLGSRHVVIKAAQIDFATKSMEVSVRLDGRSISSHDVCGGLDHGFGRDVGRREQCDTYSTCTSRFLYNDDTLAETNDRGTIVVDLPAGLRLYSCDFTAVVIAEFTSPSDPPVACDPTREFECLGERRCIPLDYVCDGIQDCESNSDETMCQQLAFLEDEAFCTHVDQAEVMETPNSYMTCLRFAVSSHTSIFSFDGVTCTVIQTAAAERILTDPAWYLCGGARVGTRTYMLLPNGRASFGLCRSTVQCFGHGVATLNPSGSCSCVCNEGRIGEWCEAAKQLQEVTEVACVLDDGGGEEAIHLGVVAEALGFGNPLVTVVCSVAVRHIPINYVRVMCSARSTRDVPSDVIAYYRSLLQPSVWPDINALLLEKGMPSLESITGRTALTPEVAMPSCNASSPSEADCQVTTSYDRLRLLVESDTSVSFVTVSSGVGGASRRSSSFECTSIASTSSTGGCVRSSCDVPRSGNSHELLSISNITFAQSTLLSATCQAPGVSVVAQTSAGNVDTQSLEAAFRTEARPTGFLVGGIIVLVFGSAIMFCLSVAMCIGFYVQRRNAFNDLVKADFALPPYHKLRADMLVRLWVLRDSQSNSTLRRDRWASATAVTSAVLAICAVFLVLYYYVAVEADGNFSVMYEEYPDDQCGNSVTGYMPRRIFGIRTDAEPCSLVQSTGETVGASFATGRCSGSGGDYRVMLQFGGSRSTCRVAAEVWRQSGVCMPLHSVDPSATRNGVYVSLTCAPSELIQRRVSVLRELTGSSDRFEVAELLTANDRLRLSPPTATRPYFTAPYLVGQTIATSSAYSSSVVSAQATPAGFDGNSDPMRLVLQIAHCTPHADTNASCVVPTEASLANSMPLLTSSTSPLSPRILEVPIGYLFGGFSTSQFSTWTAAGPGAHRYYHIRGSAFDLGLHLPKDASQRTDGDGYAVSMWLRVDTATLGFAYAVCDAFEDSHRMVVHPLERLASIIDNGGGEWFDTTYRVYHSLYVNGRGRTLTFAYASPVASPRIKQHVFDLDQIGATHVTNGQWHHIAVALAVENGRVRAQLIIDGESSSTRAGWSSCVGTLPDAIMSAPVTSASHPLMRMDANKDGVPVFDHVSDRVHRDGMLVVGYLNGGVFGLQAHLRAMNSVDFLPSSTEVIQAANAFPRTETLALGYLLLIISGILLLITVHGSITGVRNMGADASSLEFRQAARAFYSVVAHAIVNKTDRSKAKRPTRRAFARPPVTLRPIRLQTALRWLNLTLSDFTVLMKEISEQRDDFSHAILLVIYRTASKKPTAPDFTIAEWNALVDSDPLTQPGRDDAQNELAACGELNVMAEEAYRQTKRQRRAAYQAQRVTTSKNKLAQESHRIASSASSDDCSDSDGDFSPRGADNNDFVDLEQPKFVIAEREKGVANLKGVQSGRLPAAPANSSSDASKAMPMFASLIASLQGIYVWSTSIGLPTEFNDYFRESLSFLSLDMTVYFDGFGSLVTPIVQVAFVAAVLSALYYLVLEDERSFDTILARYVWARDKKELPRRRRIAFRTYATQDLLDVGDEAPDRSATGHDVVCAILPRPSAIILDYFTGRVKQPSNEVVPLDGDAAENDAETHRPTIEYVSLDEVTVVSAAGKPLTVTRDADGNAFVANGPLLAPVIGRCPMHPHRVLLPDTQSDVYPFLNRPRCCVGGCREDVGVIFSCGHEYVDASGDRCVCVYALCSDHCRPEPEEQAIAIIMGHLQSLRANGLLWLLCTIALAAADAVYTPVMKTALMIVSCHPYYQCEFGDCWNDKTTSFVMSAFLSVMVIVCLGAGLPLALFVFLQSRASRISEASLDPEHGGRYKDPRTQQIVTTEWRRFLVCDRTALVSKYKDLSLAWLYYPSLQLLLKIAVLIPSIFIEPRTLAQRVACSLIQIGVAFVVFTAQPYSSPVLVTSLRAAEVFQLAILGLVNMQLVYVNDGATGASDSTEYAMIGLTIAYVVLCLAVALLTIVWPIMADILLARRLHAFLSQHGMSYGAFTTLYKDPTVSTAVVVEDEDRVDSPTEKVGGDDATTPTTGGGAAALPPSDELLPPTSADDGNPSPFYRPAAVDALLMSVEANAVNTISDADTIVVSSWPRKKDEDDAPQEDVVGDVAVDEVAIEEEGGAEAQRDGLAGVVVDVQEQVGSGENEVVAAECVKDVERRRENVEGECSTLLGSQNDSPSVVDSDVLPLQRKTRDGGDSAVEEIDGNDLRLNSNPVTICLSIEADK